jgi:hypothetical protein
MAAVCRSPQKEPAMVREPVLACTVLIPVNRDAELSDGEPNSPTTWSWLEFAFYEQFGGATQAPGLYRGFYRDPDTGGRVSDESREYTVAVTQRRLRQLRSLLSEACKVFSQKCIYLSAAGRVEFIKAKRHEPD